MTRAPWYLIILLSIFSSRQHEMQSGLFSFISQRPFSKRSFSMCPSASPTETARRWQGGRAWDASILRIMRSAGSRLAFAPVTIAGIDCRSRKSTPLFPSPSPSPPQRLPPTHLFCLAKWTRQTLLLISSLRVYSAIITFSRLGCRCTSSPINRHQSYARKRISATSRALQRISDI